jgi:hypothetical protein
MDVEHLLAALRPPGIYVHVNKKEVVVVVMDWAMRVNDRLLTLNAPDRLAAKR